MLTCIHIYRVIQDSAAGHCSKEDAIAALDLVQLKVNLGEGEDSGALFIYASHVGWTSFPIHTYV